MAKGPTITTIASGYYSRTALNDNFTNIDTAFENTLSLDGSTPNSLGADLDLNTNDILNAGVVNAADIVVAGNSVVASATASAASAASAAVSALTAEEFARAAPITIVGTPSGVNDTQLFIDAVALMETVEYQVQKSSVLKAPIGYIYVPRGVWNITAPVPSSAIINWVLDDAADIVGAEFLTGVLVRKGQHINAKHSGILQNALTLGLRAGRDDLDAVGGVYGITSEDAISLVGPPHSVTLQIDNDTGVVPIELTGTTFTATSVVYTNAPVLSDVKTGATITTLGSTKHTGVITGVSEATKTVTIAGGWRPFTGTSAATGTPTNGDSAHIDYFDKIWGQNTNTFLRLGHPTVKMAGYEMGLLNYQADAPVLDPATNSTQVSWGYDTVNLANFKSSAGFIARAGGAPFRTGFASYGNEIGFEVHAKTGETNQVGFQDLSGEGIAFKATYNDLNSFSVASSGSMEVGRTDAASTTFIDMHSGGNAAVDYDVRIQSTGGSATAGNGTLSVKALAVDIDANLTPTTAGTNSLGTVALPWLNANIKGNVQLGDTTGASSTPFIDMMSSGLASDYDARILATGGTATNGRGTLQVAVSNIQPQTDVITTLGLSTKRLSGTYSQTFYPGAGLAKWTSGAGSPEGAITAVVGSMYTNTTGGAGTTLYVKETGTGNTGWVAK